MGPDLKPYMSNWPPREYLLEYLSTHDMKHYAEYLLRWGF